MGPLAASLPACRERKVESSKVATRVVSLGPATTEALFAIGAGKVTVGRSRFCDKPAEARALPSIGGYTDPNLEAILALRPDLVTGVRGPAGNAIVVALEQHGVATYFPETESKAQIVELLLGLGQRTGNVESARNVVAALEKKLDAVRVSVEGKPKKRALLFFGRSPLVACGKGSFPDEMLALAGLANACTSTERYPTLEVENVLAMDPDVLLDASMEGEDPSFFSGPGFSKLRAVRQKQVFRVTDMDVLRPGPSFANGVESLARTAHGALPAAPGPG